MIYTKWIVNFYFLGKSRADEAVRLIQVKSKNETVEAEILDLSSLDSIKNFADRIRKKCKRIDILVNNAGDI